MSLPRVPTERRLDIYDALSGADLESLRAVSTQFRDDLPRVPLSVAELDRLIHLPTFVGAFVMNVELYDAAPWTVRYSLYTVYGRILGKIVLVCAYGNITFAFSGVPGDIHVHCIPHIQGAVRAGYARAQYYTDGVYRLIKWGAYDIDIRRDVEGYAYRTHGIPRDFKIEVFSEEHVISVVSVHGSRFVIMDEIPNRTIMPPSELFTNPDLLGPMQHGIITSLFI